LPEGAIDRRALIRNGSHTIRLSGGRILIRSDRDVRGDRPWVIRPPLPALRLRLAHRRAVADSGQ